MVMFLEMNLSQILSLQELFVDLPQMWIASLSLGVIEVLTLVFRRPSFSNARTVLEVDHVVFIHI